MRDECKMLENQEAEYKVEIQSLVRELQHVNKKFFVQVAIDQWVQTEAKWQSKFILIET